MQGGSGGLQAATLLSEPWPPEGGLYVANQRYVVAAAFRPPPWPPEGGLYVSNQRYVVAAAFRPPPWPPEGGLYVANHRDGEKRRNRSEFITTNTELNAMAPAAIMGFSQPSAATGILTAL